MSAISVEMRRLRAKWLQGAYWPKRLEWLEIKGIRGWNGPRIEFTFPITALVGENGCGKSTILQAAASIYKGDSEVSNLFASRFFPDTPWDSVHNAEIRASLRENGPSIISSIRKPNDRWRGNQERRSRVVYYVDLGRIKPLYARAGYTKMVKANAREYASANLDAAVVSRLSTILGRTYDDIRLATIEPDSPREIPVMRQGEKYYSGFHQGAGELTATELLAHHFRKYSIVLIDEIESSLHPRAQRRLIRDIANIARTQEIQFIISTHSPYVLEEIVPEGRMYIMNSGDAKTIITGVSPEFAMSKMDDENYPECDVYVEDHVARIFVNEIIIHREKNLVHRCTITPFGAASVGTSLGIMVREQRFSRPSVVFLDGDQEEAPGTHVLPGGDAPERVVFAGLSAKNWPDVSDILKRDVSDVIGSLTNAMTLGDHHQWLSNAANKLTVSEEHLWRVLCSAWVRNCATVEDEDSVVLPVQDALNDR